jgi:hypothetical protein
LIRGFNFSGQSPDVFPDVDEPNGSAQRFSVKSACHGRNISPLESCVLNVEYRGASLLVLQPSSQRYATSLPTNIGEQRVFLSVFELVAVMTVCADDFHGQSLSARCVALYGRRSTGNFATSWQGVLSTEPQSFPTQPLFRPRTKTVVHAQKLSAMSSAGSWNNSMLITCLWTSPFRLVLAGLIHQPVPCYFLSWKAAMTMIHKTLRLSA